MNDSSIPPLSEGLQSVIRSTGHSSWENLIENTLEGLSQVLPCKLLLAWAYNPVTGQLFPKAIHGYKPKVGENWMRDSEIRLTGLAVGRKRTVILKDIQAEREGRELAQPDLAKELDLRGMISIPILNTVNMNQVLMVVNLFPKSCPDPNAAIWDDFSQDFGRLYECRLRTQCLRYSNKAVERLYGRGAKTSVQFQYKRVLEVLQEAIKCQACSLMLQDGTGREISLIATTADGRMIGEITWARGEGETGRAWSRNREAFRSGKDFLQSEPPKKFREGVPRMDQVLLVPVRDMKGRSVGVIRCINKLGGLMPATGSPFSYDDVVLVESILIETFPHFQTLHAEDQRRRIFGKLAHELRGPITAFRALIEGLQSECKRRSFEFDHAFLDDLSTYSEVMRHLLKRLDIVRLRPENLALQASPTNLLRDLVAPSIRHMRPLMSDRGLPDSGTRYSFPNWVPPMHLDKILMQQVVFNLVENAIKFSAGKRDNYRVEVSCKETDEFVELVFSDNGIGVTDEDAEKIFEEGERGAMAEEYNVTGQGLGLWVSREIVVAHGGDLRLTNKKDPTVFSIQLPLSLQEAPPDSEPKGKTA